MLVKFFHRFISTPKTGYDNQSTVSEQNPTQPNYPFSLKKSVAITPNDRNELGEPMRILPRTRMIEPVDFNGFNRVRTPSLPRSIHEKTHRWLQTHLDNPLGAMIKLIPQEYAGPFVINKPLILDGQGATLWAFKGPVLQIYSPTLTLKNLNIEVTGESLSHAEEECAIRVRPATVIHCENVQVRGQVMGIEGETGVWHYPYSLHLGQLTPRTSQQFFIQIQVPMPCQLESAIAGVHLTPQQLEAGCQKVVLTIEPLADDTSLCGSLYIKTAHLKRRIQLTAHISSTVGSKTHSLPLVWSPTSEQSLSLNESLSSPQTTDIHPEPAKAMLSTHKNYLSQLEKSVFFTKNTPKNPDQPTTTKSVLANLHDVPTKNVFFKQPRNK
jgi:hypothetical protein